MRQVEHQYTIRVFDDLHYIRNLGEGEVRTVVFQDHSDEFRKDSKGRKRPWSPPPPEPRFINIHASLAKIFHMSGAGKFLDGLPRR